MPDLFASVVIGAERDLVQECVRSLIESAGKYTVRVCVISNDGSIPPGEDLRRFSSERAHVELRLNEEPLGFAENHNRVLRNAVAEYFLVANDDLVFHDRAVELALNEMGSPGNERVGSLSPRLENADGSLQRSTYGFPTVPRALLDISGARDQIPHTRLTDWAARIFGRDGGRSRFWAHDRPADVETFRGAAMFVRADAWRDAGEFCALARVGGEIAEWHRRSLNKKWRVRFFPRAVVTHFGSRTVGRDRLLRSEYLKGYMIFFSRHSSRAALASFRTAGIGIAYCRLAFAMLMRDEVETVLWRANVSILTSTDCLKR